MTFKKQIIKNKFYLWKDDNLIYERWLDSGKYVIIDSDSYDTYSTTNLIDLNMTSPSDFIYVKAKLKMKKTEEGGRITGFSSGYRPNHVFEYKNGELLTTYIGDIQFDGQELIMPGEEKEVTVRFLIDMPIEKYLTIGNKWFIHEGPKQLGEAEILEIK